MCPLSDHNFQFITERVKTISEINAGSIGGVFSLIWELYIENEVAQI
jgi:hypothetical protein